MTSYTTPADVAAVLGVTFTPEQSATCAQLCDAVTIYIDGYTGRSWGTSPVTAELANVRPPLSPWGGGLGFTAPVGPGVFGLVYLLNSPVTAITSVTIRTAAPNAAADLLDPSAYELVDPPNGVLSLAGAWSAALGPYGLAGAPYPSLLAVVDYTYGDAVPADVAYAATSIVSGVMARTLAYQAGSAAAGSGSGLAGLDSIAVGQNDVAIKVAASVSSGSGAAFASAAESSWVTPGSIVADILASYRRPVFA